MSSWGLWFWFSKFDGEMYFWKNMLKVRCFKTSMDSRHFLIFFLHLVTSWGVGVWFTRAAIGLGAKNWRLWYFLFAFIFRRMSFFKTVLWLVFQVLWLVLQVLHTKSSDHGPLFLPSGSSYSPTHTERRRRDLLNKQTFNWNKVQV